MTTAIASASSAGSLIDLEHDELKPVAVICQTRTGKRVSPCGIWRWRTKGVRGVRLEAVLVNGCWCTTDRAFAAFIRGQTDAANAARKQSTNDAPPVERDEATTRKLKSAGLI